MRFLCIFAIPRTGSSHLNKLLKSCPEFNAKSELFHSRAVAQLRRPELEQLKLRSDGAVIDSESFRQWRRKHPLETLEALYESGRKRIVTFKVFSNHLSRELIESEFFPRQDMGFAILRRRPIDCFISGQKARSVSTFNQLDTTAIKPSLSIEEFEGWASKVRGWYKYIQQALEARETPYAEISYEKHIDGLSGAESLSKILPMLKPLGFPDVTVPRDILESERQDKETRYQDRVANWQEFFDEAQSDPGRAWLLKWAQRTS